MLIRHNVIGSLHAVRNERWRGHFFVRWSPPSGRPVRLNPPSPPAPRCLAGHKPRAPEKVAPFYLASVTQPRLACCFNMQSLEEGQVISPVHDCAPRADYYAWAAQQTEDPDSPQTPRRLGVRMGPFGDRGDVHRRWPRRVTKDHSYRKGYSRPLPWNCKYAAR